MRCRGPDVTAGRSGLLDEVSLDVIRNGPVPVQVLIGITTLDGMGRPTSTVIGSGSFYDFPGGLHDAQLDVPAPVVVGTGYAIAIRDPRSGVLRVRRTRSRGGGAHLRRRPTVLRSR